MNRENPLTGWPEQLGRDEYEYEENKIAFGGKYSKGLGLNKRQAFGQILKNKHILNIINVEKCKNKFGNNNKTN